MELFQNIEAVRKGLAGQGYLAGRETAAAVYLAWHLQKPLLVEGPAGVGKTGLAVALAGAMDTGLIRLQCYPGLDEAKALYEWNYQKQLLYINAGKDEEKGWENIKKDIFSREFLLERPLLKAFSADRPAVLLIDEVDKSDEELESFLLEALSDYQVTVPEMGTVKAKHIPLAVLTSNSSRDFSDALKRRCLHLYIPYPAVEQELAIVLLKVPSLQKSLARRVVEFVHAVRRLPLKKTPSIAETIDWARAMVLMGAGFLEAGLVADTLNILLKYEQDVQKVRESLPGLISAGSSGEDQLADGNDPGPEETGGAVAGEPAAKKSPARSRLEELLEKFDF
ncbi:MAG: MoxR family ATPase [Peptococcaceae bacterium]|nr:MoxR family ATPase [Peptococcaceae bacterium]